MIVPRTDRSCRVFAVVLAAFLFCSWAAASVPSNVLHSNSIKNQPVGGAGASAGAPVSTVPGLSEGGNKHQPGDAFQLSVCTDDDDCDADEFCSATIRGGVPGGQVCLACRRRRKRCLRDAMCCPGNYCNNGMCAPSEQDPFYPGDNEETIVENFDHGTFDPHHKRTTSSDQLHHLKGQDGATCLRSSDCAEGLCCARHFWSKICKPVLKEGQVCTKHHKKGAHGLEIFQRCHCGDGLSCRVQRDHTISNSPRLHTCQRH